LEAGGVGSVAGAIVDLRAVAAAADDADVGTEAGAAPEAVLPEAAVEAEPVRPPEAAGVANGVEAAEPVDPPEAEGAADGGEAVEPTGAAEAEGAAEAIADPEVGAAGAADRVGGIGASPDPRSEASNIGDAHVPEYALSVNVDPPCGAVAELFEPLVVGVEALEPVVAVSVDAEPDALAERAAESADVGLEAFDVAAGTAGMPKPAGDLSASAAAEDLGAVALWPRVTAPWPGAPAAAGLEADVAAEALDEIGVGAFAAGWVDAVVELDAALW
jgi:hypothetical protein